MSNSVRDHFRSNVVGYIALCVSLAGTAYAGATIGSADVVDNSLRSVDLRDGEAVKGKDVVNGSLSGADIEDQSGVDTCSHGSRRYGQLCARVMNENLWWHEAVVVCADVDLRLPSLGEARTLAMQHNFPDVTRRESFWTDNFFLHPTDPGWKDAYSVVNEKGVMGWETESEKHETVCVTTPSS